MSDTIKLSKAPRTIKPVIKDELNELKLTPPPAPFVTGSPTVVVEEAPVATSTVTVVLEPAPHENPNSDPVMEQQVYSARTVAEIKAGQMALRKYGRP